MNAGSSVTLHSFLFRRSASDFLAHNASTRYPFLDTRIDVVPNRGPRSSF